MPESSDLPAVERAARRARGAPRRWGARLLALLAALALALALAACADGAAPEDEGAEPGGEDAPAATDEARSGEDEAAEEETDAAADEAPDAVAEAVAAGAAWVTAQVDADGAVAAGFSDPASNAVEAALALAAAEAGEEAFTRAVGHVAANTETVITDDEGALHAGATGRLLLLVDAAGADPRAFGEGAVDLLARLDEARQRDGDDAGLYGQGTVFDRVVSQSFALLGLAATGETPPEEAVAWLRAQQCPDGGWPSYRDPEQRAAGTCEETDTSQAPDTNSTALAIQALSAHDLQAETDPLEWLAAVQGEGGGWAFQPAFPGSDANSTGLVLQALAARGADPSAAPWADGPESGPVAALLALQLGCDAPEEDQGAFAFQPEEDGALEPNPATYQALWGLTGQAFPLGERALAPAPAPRACPG